MLFNLAKKNTLIVEDFAEFARSVRAMLHTMGATQVDIVYNAEDAIEACKSRKYDVILSDYNLGPKKDGQQLLEELSKYALLKSNCVFLMLTAENTTAMVMGAVEYQPDGYIAKPFTGNLLKSRLQKSIEKKDALTPISRAIKNKNWSEAIENISIVVQQHPKYKMSCLRLQYRALKELKKYDEALELVTQIVAQRAIPWAMQAVGEIFYLKNETEKAIEIFKNVTTEFPMALDGYDWLAKLQQQIGQPIEAQNTLTRAIEKSPKALQRQKELGALAEENNDLDVMTSAYRNAVKYSANSAFSSPNEYIKLTSALSRQIELDTEIVADRIINEAELVFEQLDKNFSFSSTTRLRSNIAHASFCKASKEDDKEKKYLASAEKCFEELDEQIPSEISLELSESLNSLGKSELADEILDEAIKQNIDDPEFIQKASKISSNQELIKISKLASQQNKKAISFFKNKKYPSAIEHFDKAYELSPSNINICLNYVQSLLKLAQLENNDDSGVRKADNMLTAMPQLAFSDARFSRYSELSRLTQLMLQKKG